MATINYTDLRLLGIYATVVECGSFAAAARKLNSSRSRISEQISQLEQRLNTRLLQRSTRRLTTTDEGLSVYMHAKKLPELLKNIEELVTPSTPTGRVSITLNHDIAHRFLLPVLDTFNARYPEIYLDLILDDERLNLIEQQIDLGIRIGFPRDDSFVARVLHEEKFALFASRSYLDQAGIPKTVAELEHHTWVLLSKFSYSGVMLREGESSIEIFPKTFYRCNSPYMMQKMTKHGLGVAMLLPSTVKAEVEAGILLPIMPSLESESLLFSLIYPSRRHIPMRTRAVINFLLESKIFDT